MVGVFIMILILSVYGLYRNLKINKTVMTPMLLVGLLISLQGVTELFESHLGEMGHLMHAVTMLLGAIFFLYGIYSYHQMLKRAWQLR